jgi:hypothetical protein
MTATQRALAGLAGAGSLAPRAPSWADRAVDLTTRALARTSRRGFLARAGLVGSALVLDPWGYLLKPGTAYAAICGPGSGCNSGWSVFCATINNGVNACPPGSVAGGWWKSDRASLCGGGPRYIIDCNGTCTRCGSPSGSGICSHACQSCRCTCGPSSQCDQRRSCCTQFRYGQCNAHIAQVGAVQCRTVSCSPPYEWANCSTAPATDNRTRDHSSPSLPRAWTPITAFYHSLGDQGSVLGATVHGEIAKRHGTAQNYQHGRISWSRSTGAQPTEGAIAQRFIALKAEDGPLGFPIAPPLHVGNGRGRASRFQHGRISWHAAVGAHFLLQQVAAAYVARGAEGGSLGFPIGDEHPAPRQGAAADFQHGRISYRPGIGAHALHAEIAAKFRAVGAEKSPLGYPTADQAAVRDGDGQFAVFEHGRISFRPDLGAHPTVGPIAAQYAELGAERSPLGYPVGDESTPAEGLRRSEFEHGAIEYDEAGGKVTVVPS